MDARKVAIAVLAVVVVLWAVSVVLTFVRDKAVVDPTLSALMTAIVGAILYFMFENRRKGGSD